MNRQTFGLAISLALLCAAPAQAGHQQLPTLVLPHMRPQELSYPMVGRFAVLPAKQFDRLSLHEQSARSVTVPLWSRGITSGGVHYVYEMVGRSPFAKQTVQSDIKAVIIPIKLTFTSFGNAVFDPAQRDVTCSRAGTATTLVKASPLFNPIAGYPGGTYVGTGEYVDLFQRANYFTFTNPSGINPDYAVNLIHTPTAELTVNVSGGQVVPGTCGNIGMMDFDTWDNYLQTVVFPALAASSPPIASPKALAIFLLYNVVLYDGTPSNCCILGFHSAFNDPAYGNAFHTYASVEFDTNRSFTGVSDISAMSHEVAEWMDDPAGNNPTPSWGNIGQVSGCQANLEVGDPLSGTLTQIYMAANGYTYHVQDLAFTSWFYRQNQSTGVNGWYSFLGNFLAPSAPC